MLEKYTDKDVLTVKEVQSIIRTGRNSTYKLLSGNCIKHICVGKKIYVPKK